MKNNTIFVQIASYRDRQLIPTIRNALENAKHPERLFFGICWQRDEEESLYEFANHPRVKYQTYHYSESEGLGWARAKVGELYGGEDLTLQLDSHHRFAPNWDVMMIEDYNQAKEFSKKPILTTYLTPFEVSKFEETGYDALDKTPCLMSQYEFSDDKLIMSMPFYIQDYRERNTVIRSRTLSGHFYLVDAKFIEEVPYDPEIYFGGYCEETTMSIRAWTRGYDFFSPYRQYAWHEYTREGRPKHWEDHGEKSKTKKNSGERDAFARKKTRQIFRTEDNNLEIDEIFDIGNIRSLRDFEVFGGFDLQNLRMHDYTKKGNPPPNPLPWEDGFLLHDYEKNIEWDERFFKEQNIESPEVLTLGILSSSGNEIFRRDFFSNDGHEYLHLNKNSYNVKFSSFEKPEKIVMYMHSPLSGWSRRYEREY